MSSVCVQYQTLSLSLFLSYTMKEREIYNDGKQGPSRGTIKIPSKRNFFDGLLCSDLTQIFQKKINLFQTPKIAGLMRDQIDFNLPITNVNKSRFG